MNKIVNKFFSAGDTFMLKNHLRQPGVTFSACGPFTKHRERIQKFREAGHSKHNYQNELNKACFAHNAAYSDSKDLAERTILDKFLRAEAYEIAISP